VLSPEGWLALLNQFLDLIYRQDAEDAEKARKTFVLEVNRNGRVLAVIRS
jgi:hypothetical protein